MDVSPLVWMVSFSLIFLLFTSLILIRNRFELTGLVINKNKEKNNLKISVCIPVRNEEKNIGSLLDSLLDQNYPDFEILVFDDHSEDLTPDILNSCANKKPGLITILPGLQKPASWLGKPWACHQLSDQASGDILLFLDADTRLKPDALNRVASSFRKYNLDMLTVWPEQLFGTFWEKTVIPLIYYSLLTLLPSVYVYRSPKWLPGFLRKRFAEKFAAACGQAIAFTREAYKQMGGHSAVKREIVEDVELAKAVKKAGLTMRMFHGVDSVSCRMYSTQNEIFQGLRKNFLAGFGNSLPVFITAALLHLIVFLLPFYTIVLSVIYQNPALFFLSSAAISILLLQRLLLALWFRWDPLFALTHPLGVLWFQVLGIVKIIDHLTGRKTSWKGRKV